MYSEQQIKNLVQQADWSGVDLVVNTISQDTPNWELDIKSALNGDFFKTTDDLYAKLCLYGNELSLVISGQFVAKADANSYHALFSGTFNIPDEIASKIFRADGTNLTTDAGSGTFDDYITAFTVVRGNPSLGTSYCLLRSSVAKFMALTVYGFNATTEDSVCYIDLRVQLLIA